MNERSGRTVSDILETHVAWRGINIRSFNSCTDYLYLLLIILDLLIFSLS